jgi:hypothetical protein
MQRASMVSGPVGAGGFTVTAGTPNSTNVYWSE